MSENNQSLAEEAYVILRERILRGVLPIGQVISRRKIAGELGMSLLPVAEALLRLELEGMLESRPRAGTRVRIPSEQDVRGHYVVREALEVQAAKLFAEAATARERSELQKLAARVDALYTQGQKNQNNYLLFLGLHEKLHGRIAEGTHCQALVEAIEKNHALASTWLCVPREDSLNEPVRRHQELVGVLVTGTPAAAAKAMSAHIQAALQHTLHRLEPHFQQREINLKSFIRSEKKSKQQTVPV